MKGMIFMDASVKRKLKTVSDALDSLFGDTSISQDATLEALEEIQADVEGKIDALKSDMKKAD